MDMLGYLGLDIIMDIEGYCLWISKDIFLLLEYILQYPFISSSLIIDIQLFILFYPIYPNISCILSWFYPIIS